MVDIDLRHWWPRDGVDLRLTFLLPPLVALNAPPALGFLGDFDGDTLMTLLPEREYNVHMATIGTAATDENVKDQPSTTDQMGKV